MANEVRKNLDGNVIITIENPPKWLRDWMQKLKIEKDKHREELRTKKITTIYYV